jgi:hypothetical protein
MVWALSSNREENRANQSGNSGSGNDYGYLLRGGVFTSIVFPNSDSTAPTGINGNGDIVGWHLDNTGTHGFLLRGGVYTSIDFPGSAAFHRGLEDQRLRGNRG